MAEKKRYLVGYDQGSVLPKEIEQLVDTFVSEQDEVEEVRTLRGGQRVLLMNEEAAAELGSHRSDLIVEEDLVLELFSPMPGLPPRFPTEPPVTLSFKAIDAATEKPVGNVTIYCFGEALLYQGLTGKNGVAKIPVQESSLKQVIASPRNGYWSKVVACPDVQENAHLDIVLEKLPLEEPCNWSQLELGVDLLGEKFTGKGVKIAFVDSGIAPHEGLKVAGGYNALEGADPDDWKADEKGHGTHCSGIVAAQVGGAAGIRGMAPEAEVYGVKVSPGGRFSDLIEAVNWCIDNYMDVISISLGSRQPSQQVEQVLMDAYLRGITCVAAAGNDAGEVSYPAAYSHVVAVSAVGKKETFPAASAHALKASDYVGYDGNFFFANFSNYGAEIDVCAPGVAIPSTVPKGYAAWDGTSMACTHVAGLAALILEAYPELRTGDAYQPYYVRQVIADSATDLGLPTEMQGAGLANAAAALESAYARRIEEEQSLAVYREYLQGMLERAKQAANAIEESLARLESL